jgi:hypothetical protein
MRVWQVLTGLERYAEWNPQIPSASGRLEVGGRIRLRLALPARPALDLSATIEEVLPERLLTWRGHVVKPWLFEGYRKFAIQPIDSTRTSVTHVERASLRRSPPPSGPGRPGRGPERRAAGHRPVWLGAARRRRAGPSRHTLSPWPVLPQPIRLRTHDTPVAEVVVEGTRREREKLLLLGVVQNPVEVLISAEERE